MLTTHAHFDHIGSLCYFSYIAVHEAELKWIEEKFPLPLKNVKDTLMKEPHDFPDEFDIDKYQIFQGKVNFVLKNQKIIDLGNR